MPRHGSGGGEQLRELGVLDAHSASMGYRLVRSDGSMPDSDDEPGLVAVLARSY